MTPIISTELQFLTRPAGRISYTVSGTGPLIVAVPGMGDLRSSYGELAGPLIDAGFRVALLDLRGHGDADTTFTVHGDEATAGDILALVDELGGPAVVIGNSMAGSAALIAAADRPDAVAGLVLLSPFLRQSGGRASLALNRMLFGLLFARPWGARFWTNYYATTLNRGTRSPGLAEHVAEIAASMRNPARLASFRHLALQLDHTVVESRIALVVAPSLTVIGSVDPDYKNPADELAFAGEALGGETVLVDDTAHYPHMARPDVVSPRVLAFVDGLRRGSEWRAPRA
ncbi:MAG: alpha/beta hydrolase [Actinomycetota bacterium]|nr:alpha/beta hydrolase [Actinomycetota bacterium]